MLSYSRSRQLSAKLVGLKRVYLGFFFIAIRDHCYYIKKAAEGELETAQLLKDRVVLLQYKLGSQ